MLKDAGLNQYEKANKNSIHGCGFGDYSVRNQTITTYSRISPKHKTHRKSVNTGKIEIEIMFTANPRTQDTIRDLLLSNGFDFVQTYNGFLLN